MLLNRNLIIRFIFLAFLFSIANVIVANDIIDRPFNGVKLESPNDIIRVFGNPLKTEDKKTKNNYGNIDKQITMQYEGIRFDLIDFASTGNYLVEIEISSSAFEIFEDIRVGVKSDNVFAILGMPDSQRNNKFFYRGRNNYYEFIIDDSSCVTKIIQHFYLD